MKKLQYDTNQFAFKEAVQQALNFNYPLEQLHKFYSWELKSRETDQFTPIHARYYDNYESLIAPLWEQFVSEVIAPQMEGDFLYQKIPTFRVQLPENVAVGEFHKDSKYGHQDGAVNLYIPLTDLNEYNTILVETEDGSNEYTPLLCKYGEFFEWDGVNRNHGNLPNESDITRVSIDARIVPGDIAEKMKPSKSINMKVPLVEGGYYKRYASKKNT